MASKTVFQRAFERPRCEGIVVVVVMEGGGGSVQNMNFSFSIAAPVEQNC